MKLLMGNMNNISKIFCINLVLLINFIIIFKFLNGLAATISKFNKYLTYSFIIHAQKPVKY